MIGVAWNGGATEVGRRRGAGVGRALDPGADTDDVAAGTRLDLPLWLLRNIANRNMVELQCAPAPLPPPRPTSTCWRSPRPALAALYALRGRPAFSDARDPA